MVASTAAVAAILVTAVRVAAAEAVGRVEMARVGARACWWRR